MERRTKTKRPYPQIKKIFKIQSPGLKSVKFHRPDGSTCGNAGHGSVLVAYGAVNMEWLRLSEINGRYLVL